MRLAFAADALSLFAFACGDTIANIYGAPALAPDGGASGGEGGASSSTATSSAVAASSSAGQGGAASISTAVAASSGVASSSSSVAATGSSGAGGAPSECASAADGTKCTETCGCPPCAPAQAAHCASGLCQAGACVAYVEVVCNVGGTLYTGCDGSASPNFISWDTDQCAGLAQDPHYCAPGKACTVLVGQVYKGMGVCQ